MATGIVKFFNTQKGFGFITPSDGSRDVFVQISAVERSGMNTLHEGQRLTMNGAWQAGCFQPAKMPNLGSNRVRLTPATLPGVFAGAHHNPLPSHRLEPIQRDGHEPQIFYWPERLL